MEITKESDHSCPRLWKSFADFLKNNRLTPSEIKLLDTLENTCAKLAGSALFECSVSALKAACRLSRRTIFRALKRLEELGILRRTRSKDWRKHEPNLYELLRPWTGRKREPTSDAEKEAREAVGLSPIKYPGSKNWFIPTMAAWLRRLRPRPRQFIEPFAGGASVGLAIAQLQLADQVVLVERDRDVAALWSTIFCDPGGINWLCSEIERFDTSDARVDDFLACYFTTARMRGFQRLVLSYTKFAGIARAGRVKSNSDSGFRKRWKVVRLIQRLTLIDRLRDRIRFIEGDGLDYIREHHADTTACWFLDPPYPSVSAEHRDTRFYDVGVNSSKLFDLAAKIQGPWLMTNEHSWRIEDLVEEYGFVPRVLEMKTNMSKTRKELLIGRDLSLVPGTRPFRALIR